MENQKKRIVFLVGPTAAGKSEVGVYLEKKLNAEIISCDSMQIYKGMDIITSKLSDNLRKKIPHHLLDIISPTREYNVFRYRKDALRKIEVVFKKGRVPLFVGGTGLYMSVLLDGIFKAGAQNKAMRNHLYREAEHLGSAHLHKSLQEVDPEAALKIHPHDTKRIIRALEVFKSTGKPISCLQKQRKGLNQEYDVKIFCLNMKRGQLYKRIAERVDMMFSRGLIAEVKKLLRLKLSKTASCAIGIKELKGYFDGRYDLEEAKRLIKRNTRLYAKRQLTWFRKDKRIHWIEVKDKEKTELVANRIIKEFKKAQ